MVVDRFGHLRKITKTSVDQKLYGVMKMKNSVITWIYGHVMYHKHQVVGDIGAMYISGDISS